MIPTAEDIKKTVFSLKDESTYEPDGFGGIFYHKYWDVIKFDVTNIVTHFFLQGWISNNCNANVVVLIPKVPEDASLMNYRLIAMANFKFKIISKILADRLATLLPFLISKQQNGFISRRNIRDNICLTSEAINLLNNKSFSGNVAIKIDFI